jgi:tripartite-type tricarboxylate transporter receptor subunit TctC
VATEMVVRSPANGYTLLFIGSPNAINTSLYTRLNFNFSRDIAPVAAIVSVPNVMVVHPSVPVTTVPEFIAYAKANPGKINMASSGVGSTPHLAGELFKMMAGVDIQHVPYRGAAPAMTDLLAGQVQVYFVTTPSSMQYIKSGQLRAIAVTTAKRVSELPGLPAISEFVPGYDASAWYGLGAPRDTPKDIINKLNREINAAVADASIKKRFDDLGCTIIAGSPADLAKLITDDTERWAKVVRFAGLKAD